MPEVPHGYDFKDADIKFGNCFNYDLFVNNIKKNNIFFDSGMHQGNMRNYSQWRTYKEFWLKLINWY